MYKQTLKEKQVVSKIIQETIVEIYKRQEELGGSPLNHIEPVLEQLEDVFGESGMQAVVSAMILEGFKS